MKIKKIQMYDYETVRDIVILYSLIAFTVGCCIAVIVMELRG